MINDLPSEPASPSSQWFIAAMQRATPRVFIAPGIVLVNVLVYIAMGVSGVNWLTPSTSDMLSWGANNWHWTTYGQWWRLVSSAFLHYGPLHLAFNMYALYHAGMFAERLYGNFMFAIVYLFSAITGGLLSIAFSHNTVSAGASGAVFGVYGALLAYLMVQRGSVPRDLLKPLWSSASMFILYNIVFGLGHRGIDNAAHIGGLAGGAFLGALAALPLEARRRSAQRLWRVPVSLVAGAAVIAAGVRAMPRCVHDPALEHRFAVFRNNFAKQEGRLVDRFNNLLRQRQNKKITDDDFAADIEKVILPGWEGLFRQVSALTLPNTSPSSGLLSLLRDYIGLRRDSYAALLPALRKGDQAQSARYDQLHARAEALIPKITEAIRNADAD